MGIRCKIYDNFVDGVEDAHQEDEKIALVSDEVTKEDDILVRGRQLSCFDTPAPIRGCSVELGMNDPKKVDPCCSPSSINSFEDFSVKATPFPNRNSAHVVFF